VAGGRGRGDRHGLDQGGGTGAPGWAAALPARASGIVELLAPALLGALVATQALGDGRALVLDERLFGLAAAGIAPWWKAPMLVVVVVAAAATALTRAVM
jgi:hypothetical protein